MAKYKFAVMVTETVTRLKEIEVEGEDLYAAQSKVNNLLHEVNKDQVSSPYHLILEGVDHGDISKWSYGQFTYEECAEVFHEAWGGFDDDNPCMRPPWSVEAIVRLTPEQAAEEEREQQEISERTKDIREAFLKRLSGE